MSSLWLKRTSHYRGHRLHCPPGVQEAALELLRRANAPRTGVLDIASGGGSLRARLADAGFDDLQGVARRVGVFGGVSEPEDLSCLDLDLNGEFAGGLPRRFSLALALEVIEHLLSPRDFLTQVHRLLEKDGLLLLSTPNVANWVGRIRFLLLGDLRWFDERRVRDLRHISPLPDAPMRAMLAERGFELVAHTSAGSFSGPLRKLVAAPLALPFVALRGRAGWGDCNLYLARRVEAVDR